MKQRLPMAIVSAIMILCLFLLSVPYLFVLPLPHQVRSYLANQAWLYLVPILLISGGVLTILWARYSWTQAQLMAKRAFWGAIAANLIAVISGIEYFNTPPGIGVGPSHHDIGILLVSLVCLLISLPICFYRLIRRRNVCFDLLVVILGVTPIFVYSIIVEYAAAYIGFGFK